MDLEKLARQLTALGRDKIPDSEFALPGERKYPIQDLPHAKNALARVSQFGNSAERSKVRSAVYSRYPELRESFVERHGESPTSKKNIKKVTQGGK